MVKLCLSVSLRDLQLQTYGCFVCNVYLNCSLTQNRLFYTQSWSTTLICLIDHIYWQVSCTTTIMNIFFIFICIDVVVYDWDDYKCFKNIVLIVNDFVLIATTQNSIITIIGCICYTLECTFYGDYRCVPYIIVLL